MSAGNAADTGATPYFFMMSEEGRVKNRADAGTDSTLYPPVMRLTRGRIPGMLHYKAAGLGNYTYR